MEAIRDFWEIPLIRYFHGIWKSDNLSNGFSVYLKVPIDSDTIEVPSFAKTGAIAARREGFKNLIIPLSKTPGSYERRQASRMLKDFYNQEGICRLIQVVSSKGDVYYGLPGLICDKDMHIIFLSTCTMDITENMTGIITRVNTYIDYRVLENTDKILEKTFYRQYLPYIREEEIYPDMMSIRGILRGSDNIQKHPVVIIDDIDSKFKVTPVPPVPGEDFEEEINNNLRRSINAL